MKQIEHIPPNWIENYADYIGVLRCTNQLQVFERETIVRAFQTYQFSDATTSGDDPSFVHIESGTIIRHEGDLLAIDYGDVDRWEEMLPDLFLTLSALGWKTAEAFHDPGTMIKFLADLGRAIPANIDFDIIPAETGQKLSAYPAAQNLLARGRQLVGMGQAESNQAVTKEVQSFLFSTPEPTLDVSAVKPTGPIVLQDDDDEDLDESITLSVASAPSHSAAVTDIQLDYPEEPAVFQIPDEVDAQSLPAADIPAAPLANEVVQTEQVSTDTLQSFAAKPEYRASTLMVGASLFIFNTPEKPLCWLEGEVEYWAGKYEVDEPLVKHVDIGQLNPSLRWDLLGEIEGDERWFIEKLLLLMSLKGCVDFTVLSSAILAIKDKMESPDMRSLIEALGDKSKQHFSTSPLLGMVRDLPVMSDNIDALVRRFSPLVLCPKGQSFIDMPSSPEDPAAEVFTIRELAQQTTGCVYVFHVDALDGPFYSWLAGYLREVAFASHLNVRSCS